MTARYYLKEDRPGSQWREVSEEQFVAAERRCGFVPKDSLPQDKPATGGFGVAGGTQGKVRYDLRGALNPVFKALDQIDEKPLWFGDNPPMDKPSSPV